jgi:EEF1A N-terminal glycine/lysine methyltransferase
MTDSEEELCGLFEEPTDYYQPEKSHSFIKYNLCSGEELNIRLVGQSPLWGHILWNAAYTVAEFLESHASDFVQDKYVLEFGAGSGLPSIVAALNGAARVVVTDYPDNGSIYA